jgi:hypothetical protein
MEAASERQIGRYNQTEPRIAVLAKSIGVLWPRTKASETPSAQLTGDRS